VYKRKIAHVDIERRIAERDDLLASVQRARREATDALQREPPLPDDVARLVLRLQRVERALECLLDYEWLAAASMEDLAAHAREALLPEIVDPPPVKAPENALPAAPPHARAKRT
jgi:hypothetical protein